MLKSGLSSRAKQKHTWLAPCPGLEEENESKGPQEPLRMLWGAEKLYELHIFKSEPSLSLDFPLTAHYGFNIHEGIQAFP